MPNEPFSTKWSLNFGRQTIENHLDLSVGTINGCQNELGLN